MARSQALSGFPEFLPAQRIVEQAAIDLLRETFELHGFAGIETRAVEPMAALTRKGEITKEVYVIRRLHAAAEDAGDDLGLHFDLTVPLARYVLENSGHLHFPFRRYQIQKVWRGERPQERRYREFVQADIDIVGEASDGDEAVALARRLRPDVCVFDIRMPGLDGIEATRLLAGPGVDDPMAVVVITTFDLDEYVFAALRAGAKGFLLKDAGAQLLAQAVRAAASIASRSFWP